ncbi:MAG: hypothetical protein WC852_03820, partial [Candidatus Nanoarchaeia archaeon]
FLVLVMGIGGLIFIYFLIAMDFYAFRVINYIFVSKDYSKKSFKDRVNDFRAFIFFRNTSIKNKEVMHWINLSKKYFKRMIITLVISSIITFLIFGIIWVFRDSL